MLPQEHFQVTNAEEYVDPDGAEYKNLSLSIGHFKCSHSS